MARIAQLVDCFAYGTAKSVIQLCDALADRHQFTLFYGVRQGTQTDIDDVGGRVKLVPLPATGPLRHRRNLRFLRDRLAGQFDVLHGHSSHGGMYAKWLGQPLGIRAYYSPRGYSFLRQDLPGPIRAGCRLADRWTAARAVTIGCGPHEATLARSLGGDVVQINNASRRTDPLPVGELNDTILGVGRVNHQKGFDRFTEVARRLPQCRFDWIGEVQSPASPLLADLPRNVRRLDYLPHAEVLDRIARCRLIFLPSRWEGLSRFLIESICAGKAIVTSAFPGNQDCLFGEGKRGESGGTWYDNGFAADEVDALTDAVSRLATDDSMLGRMQTASATAAAEHFDIDRIIDRWDVLYGQGRGIGLRPVITATTGQRPIPPVGATA